MHSIDDIPGVIIFKKDFYDQDAPALLMQALGGAQADCVLSDMASHATGHRQTDHINIIALVEAGYDFARQVLKPGGTYLAKVLRGGTENQLLAMMKKDFATVRHVKPMASRDESAELFVLATGFRG
jgi:23S rRNA (uridine2552-2'-O)-methyltransferase